MLVSAFCITHRVGPLVLVLYLALYLSCGKGGGLSGVRKALLPAFPPHARLSLLNAKVPGSGAPNTWYDGLGFLPVFIVLAVGGQSLNNVH